MVASGVGLLSTSSFCTERITGMPAACNFANSSNNGSRVPAVMTPAPAAIITAQ